MRSQPDLAAYSVTSPGEDIQCVSVVWVVCPPRLFAGMGAGWGAVVLTSGAASEVAGRPAAAAVRSSSCPASVALRKYSEMVRGPLPCAIRMPRRWAAGANGLPKLAVDHNACNVQPMGCLSFADVAAEGKSSGGCSSISVMGCCH